MCMTTIGIILSNTSARSHAVVSAIWRLSFDKQKRVLFVFIGSHGIWEIGTQVGCCSFVSLDDKNYAHIVDFVVIVPLKKRGKTL